MEYFVDCSALFPFWENLNEEERSQIERLCRKEHYSKGYIMHRSEDACKGLMTVVSGALRVYVISDEGREVTLFRVFDGEVCVLSASCLLDSIDFDVIIEASDDTDVLIIPSLCLNDIMKHNPYVDLYMYKTATEKFSDVMWTIQQILFKNIDQRVAQFLWEECNRSGEVILTVTHDEIARFIGSAREVVTKVLKYLAMCEVIELKRGKIVILDKNNLKRFL